VDSAFLLLSSIEMMLVLHQLTKALFELIGWLRPRWLPRWLPLLYRLPASTESIKVILATK
jgi:hypothetical protein